MTTPVITSLSQEEVKKIKNTKIKNTLKETRKRRKTQTAKTYECKIVRNKLSVKQLNILDKMFLEAKWYYNNIIHHLELNDLNNFDTKVKTVEVRLGKDNDNYDTRVLEVLPASVKQKFITQVKDNLKGLKTLKSNGHKAGNC